MAGKTIIVQGAQYGSEGKGQIAAVLSKNVKYAVRTGSINAGHTVYYKGVGYAMQIIPTAWIHPNVQLVLGAGCYIEPTILERECDLIHKLTGHDPRSRLWIDVNCVWFGVEEANRAKEANRHHAMGATGKGASEGIITKMRDRSNPEGLEAPHPRLFKNHPLGQKYFFHDTTAFFAEALSHGDNVLLEGTQGSLLDFNLGPYPFVTTRSTSASSWLAEAGIPATGNIEVALVMRSYPIRVAGNSGPMPREISWPILAREINRKRNVLGFENKVASGALEIWDKVVAETTQELYPNLVAEVGIDLAANQHRWDFSLRSKWRVALSEVHAIAWTRLSEVEQKSLSFFEKTTVTKKLRRIARLDLKETQRAIRINGPTYLVYTFLNYIYPELENEVDVRTILMTAGGHIEELERDFGVPIRWVTTGPGNEHVIDLRS